MQSSPSARTDAVYDVVVSGLDRSIPEVVAGFERVFGLDTATAEALVSSLPATVCHGVNEIRAQYFMRALRGIGARVELRGEGEVAPAHPVSVQPAPANDNDAPLSAASVRAATLLMGSAATLHAVPAPQLPAAAPRASLPLEPTQPKAAFIDAGPRWGELVREAPKPQPVSRPIAAQPENRPSQEHKDPASYGELSLPAPADGLALVSLSPAAPTPGRERIPPQPPAPPLPAAAPRPEPKRAVVAAAVPKAPVPAPVELDPEFWSELPALLSFPWRARGLFWFVSIGLWAFGVSVLSALAKYVPFVGTSFIFGLNTSVLALCADYHRRCMWAVANAESALEEGPDFDPVRILHQYMRAGLHLLLFVFVSQLPLALWLVNAVMDDGVESGINLVLSRRFWLLAALPSLYWPMAVATASLFNRYQGIWYVPVGLRAVFRAPLEYACIALIGCATFALPWLVCTLIGRAAGLPAAFFWAVAGLPLAASHAIMGALTGQLMRARPQLFESAD